MGDLTRFLLALVLAGLVHVVSVAPLQAEETIISGVIDVLDVKNLTIVLKTRGMAHAFSLLKREVVDGLQKGDAVTAEINGEGIVIRITKTTEPVLKNP